ncbi:DUF6182 family protein [Streptomyces sp. MS1.HAVA.3]|uniref:DUF6182 family protein n=1 Tax=Streptomyces caledonius TaxID=3134107 RepID=A0ABU8U2W8_9ACTN
MQQPVMQQRLREAAAARIRTARPELADRYDLTTADGLLAVQTALGSAESAAGADGAADGGSLAVVVLSRFGLPSWIRATCAFALGLDPETADAWRRSFTRTVFLAGNPDNLSGRFRFARLSEDRAAAWTTPAPAAETASLRRLLKAFHAPRPLPVRQHALVEIPADGAAVGPRRAPVHRELYVATTDCSVSEALVHLNHLLTEAALDGLIAPGDRLTLRHVPRLISPPTPFAALRVALEPAFPGRLRAVAGLTEEIPLV